MKQGRSTTQEERIQIARECLESGKNYGKLALKYNVSYQQTRTWTLRFEELGEVGLEDRRGKRKKDQTPRTELEAAQIEIEQLKHKLYLAEMERDLLKNGRDSEGGCLGQVMQGHLYRAVRDCHAAKRYPVEKAGSILHISRAAYHRWASGKLGKRTTENEKIAEKVEQIHMDSPDKGYRRINGDLGMTMESGSTISASFASAGPGASSPPLNTAITAAPDGPKTRSILPKTC